MFDGAFLASLQRCINFISTVPKDRMELKSSGDYGLKKQKVLIEDKWFMFDEVTHGESLAQLESVADVVRRIPKSDEEMIECLRVADAVMLDSYPLTSRIIEKTERLKIISRVGIGYDSVDLEAATRKKIIVTNVPGALSHSVAEHTFLLVLAVVHRVVAADNYARNGRWDEFQESATVFELAD